MNTRTYTLLATLTATLAGSLLCRQADAALVNLTGAGNFSVTAKKYDVTIGGQTVHAMVYEDDNNPLPAPPGPNGIPVLVMRLSVGQMVTCKFTNKLPTSEVPEGASIHWHGIELDNDSDGTAVTQDSVLENQSITYRFKAPRPGIFWFHSHMVPGDTLFAGVYGVIIVANNIESTLIATNGLPSEANSFTLAMTDIQWDTRPTISGTNNPSFGRVGKINAAGQFQTINDIIHACALGGGQAVCQLASYPGDTVLVNGQSPDKTPAAVTYNVLSGQMIRLRLLDEALTRVFYLRLLDPGSNQVDLIRIGGQGGLLNNARREGGVQNGWDTLYAPGAILLSSGERSDVVATIPAGLSNGTTLTLTGGTLTNLGQLFNYMQDITTNYPVAYFKVTGNNGAANPPIADGSAILAGTSEMITNLSGTPTGFITPAPFGGSTSTTIKLTQPNAVPSIDGLNLTGSGANMANVLDGNSGNGSVWSIPHLSTTRYAHIGDLLELTVQNTTTPSHPYHLHGFSMQPVSMTDGAGTHAFAYKEFLDTIDVYGGQSLVFRILLEDRTRNCDQSSGSGVGVNSGPVLAPCAEGTPGGGLGRWLYHCHIGAHGVLGMIGEIVVLGNAQQPMTFQPPDTTTNGVDVLATVGTGSQTVADDFQWLNAGPITHVTIWGSWTNDFVDPAATFELKFWTDVPASLTTPSRPGWQAWEKMFPPGTYVSAVYANPPYEGFYDPSQPAFALRGDSQVWQYDFDISNPTNSFYPPPGSFTNWLSVTAYPTQPNANFGWKSCLPAYSWGDDATWSGTTYGPHWTDLHYPFGHPYYPLNLSMDMAFQLFIAGVAPGTPSFHVVGVPPRLGATLSGGQLVISWPGGGTLQYADEIIGPWHDIGGAAAPYPVPTDSPRRFYRVHQP
jgi:FtsP/CotA-like multicopper oxidase with cupredoxin domain